MFEELKISDRSNTLGPPGLAVEYMTLEEVRELEKPRRARRAWTRMVELKDELEDLLRRWFHFFLR